MAKMLVLKLLQLDTSEFAGRCYFHRLLLLLLGIRLSLPVFLAGFLFRAFWWMALTWSSSWIWMASSARTALGHSLIRCQVISRLTSTWVDFTHKPYHLQTLFPISQFLEIRSTSDSDGEGSLSIMAPLAFGPEAEGTE